jgi:hypothetical protein
MSQGMDQARHSQSNADEVDEDQRSATGKKTVMPFFLAFFAAVQGLRDAGLTDQFVGKSLSFRLGLKKVPGRLTQSKANR